MRRIVSLILTLMILVQTLPYPADASGYYVYTDPANGNSFQVDSSWVQETIADDPMYQVKFTHSSHTDSTIRYGSQDVWSRLSIQEQNATPREAYNHTMYQPKDIAEYLGVAERFVKTVTISGNTFFLAESLRSNFIFVEIDTTHLVHIRNGWMYLYSFSGSRLDSQFKAFKKMAGKTSFPVTDPVSPGAGSTNPTQPSPGVAPPAQTDPTAPSASQPIATTPPVNQPIETTPAPAATQPIAPSESDIYSRAKAAYESGDYLTANELFCQIPTYLDSADYLRLLRIRWYGGNIGIGVVYDHGKALTQEQKEDIDAAVRKFDFADTARVLMWNVDVATYILFGEWYTDNGMYLKWHIDKVGGFYYTRSNKLSTAISNTVSINDGYLRVDIETANKLVFHIRLTSPDTMELYCYQYDKVYTLTRK